MFAVQPSELTDAWVKGEESARWRSAGALGPSTGAASSGCSVLEVDAGCRLPWHTDSAEETIVVLSGTAHVSVGDEAAEASAGGLVLVPAGVPHEVRSVGDDVLRFVAFYAGTDVTTRYRQPVEPDGSTERSPVA